MNWPIVTLAEVTDGPQYGAIARGTTEPIGPRFIRQTDITSGDIDWTSVPYCDLPWKDFAKYEVFPGDVLISRLGNGVGNSAIVKGNAQAVFAGYLVRFSAKPELLNPSFLGYQLRSPSWRAHVSSFRSGAAQPTLNASQMGAFVFALPPLPIQTEIAETLGSLDDKVESNLRAIGLLELLGDSFFRAASDTRTPLTAVANLVMGSSPPGTSYNESGAGLPFYQGVRDYGLRYPSHRVWTVTPVRIAESGDTLISVRAPVGRLNRASEKCCIGRGLAAVNCETPSTIYYSLRASSGAWAPYEQEGTVFGAITRQDLAETTIPWPSESQVHDLESRLAIVDDKIKSLLKECELLRTLRDTLLPELLSGRIRVGEAAELTSS